MSFETMNLGAPILAALQSLGHDTPTDVQAQAVPPALQGRDLMVSARTGSGKTASFMLPALEKVLASRSAPGAAQSAPAAPGRFSREQARPTGPRILVLTPTRELALQVTDAALAIGQNVPRLRVLPVVGGVPYGAQLRALAAPLDILIATPGRLMDHMGSGRARLDHVEMLVLDEADRMLDMGFIDDIRQIAEALPAQRQTVMYSATFGGNVGQLAQGLLRDPLRVDVASHTETHADIEQRLHWADDFAHKNALLDHILTERDIDQALVFTRTQRDADELADRLQQQGHFAAALHGGMPQARRNRVLDGLRSRRLRVLVATDVAARGIDVPSISHVINFGLPLKAEDYVHRIGRTGRAGRQGLAVTLADRGDIGLVKQVQRYTTQPIPAAVIEGLEPRRAAPELFDRPGGPRKGKPMPGGHRRAGGPGRGGPKGGRHHAGGGAARAQRSRG